VVKYAVKIVAVVFIGEALVVLCYVSKVVEVSCLKLVENLFIIALGRVAVLFHEVVPKTESETWNTRLPVNVSDVERKVPSRVEREGRKNFSVPLLLIDVLYVDEVSKNIGDTLHFLPNLLELVCLIKKGLISYDWELGKSLHRFSGQVFIKKLCDLQNMDILDRSWPRFKHLLVEGVLLGPGH
jgi:hypothetical protein